MSPVFELTEEQKAMIENFKLSDPEDMEFCVCGHLLKQHRPKAKHRRDLRDATACQANEPDQCTCLGFRRGRRTRRW